MSERVRAEPSSLEAARSSSEPRPASRAAHPGFSAGRSSAPSIVHEVLESTGEPLDGATRALMESRFNHDFSHVRVHTDSKAAESADTMNATAYTTGPAIVFARGQYHPATTDGRRLLAHELVHVVQQEGTAWEPPDRGFLVDPAGVAERDASRIADDVVALTDPAALRRAVPKPHTGWRMIQRQRRNGEPVSPLDAPFQEHASQVVAAFDDQRKPRTMTVTKLLKILQPFLLNEPRARYAFLGRVPNDIVDPDKREKAREFALERATKWRNAILAMVDKRRWPEPWFRVAFASGTAQDPEVEVVVEFAPVVLSAGTTPPLRYPREPRKRPTGVTAEFKAPLTVIVKAGGEEVLKAAIPEELKVSTPPLGSARRVVVSINGKVNDLLKLVKPEESKPEPPKPATEEPEYAPPPPQPGAAPIEPGPPVSAGLSISVQAGPSVGVKLSGTYNLETRQLTTGLSFVVTTPYGECALPSGAARSIVDAIKTLEKFGVTSRAETGGSPMAAPAKPSESALAPGTAPAIAATDVPEAGIAIAKAIATLVDQMDAIKKAQEQCRKKKRLKTEIGPTLTLPLGEQAPSAPKAPSAGVNLRIYFD